MAFIEKGQEIDNYFQNKKKKNPNEQYVNCFTTKAWRKFNVNNVTLKYNIKIKLNKKESK